MAETEDEWPWGIVISHTGFLTAEFHKPSSLTMTVTVVVSNINNILWTGKQLWHSKVQLIMAASIIDTYYSLLKEIKIIIKELVDIDSVAEYCPIGL